MGLTQTYLSYLCDLGLVISPPSMKTAEAFDNALHEAVVRIR